MVGLFWISDLNYQHTGKVWLIPEEEAGSKRSMKCKTKPTKPESQESLIVYLKSEVFMRVLLLSTSSNFTVCRNRRQHEGEHRQESLDLYTHAATETLGNRQRDRQVDRCVLEKSHDLIWLVWSDWLIWSAALQWNQIDTELNRGQKEKHTIAPPPWLSDHDVCQSKL